MNKRDDMPDYEAIYQLSMPCLDEQIREHTERKSFEKKDFTISLADAKRICDGLELAASYDKTRIYYELKKWINEQ